MPIMPARLAADMAENRLGDFEADAELLQICRDGSANVVNGPRRLNTGRFLHRHPIDCFCAAEAGNGRLASRSEDKALRVADARQTLKQADSVVAERDLMVLPILASLLRKYPKLRVEGHLFPPHAGDFVAALAGQKQELADRSERPSDDSERIPCEPDFRVA